MDLESINKELEKKTAEDRIEWAYDNFNYGLVLSSSFGEHSAVMLHLAVKAVPRIPVIFVDNGYHTSETYRFKKRLTEMFELNLHTFFPLKSRAEREALEGKPEEHLGDEEWFRRLAEDVKVEPFERGLKQLNAKAWMSGVMGEETKHREGFSIVMKRDDDLYRIHPIIEWGRGDCLRYIVDNHLPLNGYYRDICKMEGMECGIHLTDMDSRTSSQL
tara:strand:- start:322 stop:972 length:651 start_codon:yes stop_codon:yes gene_type:complete